VLGPVISWSWPLVLPIVWTFRATKNLLQVWMKIYQKKKRIRIYAIALCCILAYICHCILLHFSMCQCTLKLEIKLLFAYVSAWTEFLPLLVHCCLLNIQKEMFNFALSYLWTLVHCCMLKVVSYVQQVQVKQVFCIFSWNYCQVNH